MLATCFAVVALARPSVPNAVLAADLEEAYLQARVVPASPPPQTYTVQAGDSASSVGARFGTPWYAIVEENHLTSPYMLVVGQVLTIPPAGFQATPLPLPQPPPAPPSPAPPASSSTTTSSAPSSSGTSSTASSAPSSTTTSSAPSSSGTSSTASAAPSSASSGTSPMPASSSFEACVAFNESTDGELSSNIYGILPSTWTANGFPGSPYTASPAEQQAAFQTIYANDGTAPWAPYDGC